MNTDHATTAAGSVGALAVASQIDLAKLISGDHAEISKAIGALALVLLGYFTNKVKK